MRNKLRFIIDTFSEDAQKLMAIEEMSELMKEICKDFRGNTNKDAIKEEIADVLVMIEQLRIIYDIKLSDVHKIMNEKIERALTHVKNGTMGGKTSRD